MNRLLFPTLAFGLLMASLSYSASKRSPLTLSREDQERLARYQEGLTIRRLYGTTNKNTALKLAAKNNKMEAIKDLLERGTDADDQQHGDTTLHFLAKYGVNSGGRLMSSNEILKHLLDDDSVLLKGNNGGSSLQAFKYLLERGANPYLKDKDNKDVTQILNDNIDYELRMRKIVKKHDGLLARLLASKKPEVPNDAIKVSREMIRLIEEQRKMIPLQIIPKRG